MPHNTPDYNALFHEYIRICNAALDANKDCFPYSRILQEIEDRLKFHPVRVAVYEEDENNPVAFFEIVMQDKRITAGSPRKSHAKHPWRISRHYLEEVTQHADTYITNPAQLDWVWLNDRTID